MTSREIEAVYDPVLKRYRALCPHCDYAAVRAKREAAEHIVAQHAAYTHATPPAGYAA